MAEIVGSAVVQESVSKILESVSKILSGVVQKYEEKHTSNAFRNLERLEMAHIRLEAVLQTSKKWDIADRSMLHWRRKLKSAAYECHDTLHKWKQRILENEQVEKEVSNFSLHKRVVHATRSFISFIYNHDNSDLNRSTVQRFEWFADCTSEFLRLLELGGKPRCLMPFDPLIRHLLAGKILQHTIIRENKCPLFLQLAPFFSAEHGIQGRLYIMKKDPNVPFEDFVFTVTLQLSESTYLVGVAIQCLQLFAPLFMSTVENIRKSLMQLTTQDFSWVPYVDSSQKIIWDNVHRCGSQWFRLNPSCCNQHGKHNLCQSCKRDNSCGLPYVSLEPVIYVGLWCQVSHSESNKQGASLPKSRGSPRDHPYQRAGVIFAPHGSSQDMFLVDTFPAIEATICKEQHCLHTTVFSLGQLQQIMLPKAKDFFCQNEEATVYQMLWRSKHGTAYIQVERANIFMPSRRRTFHGPKRRKLLQGPNEECLTYCISHFLDLLTSHSSIQLENKNTSSKSSPLEIIDQISTMDRSTNHGEVKKMECSMKGSKCGFTVNDQQQICQKNRVQILSDLKFGTDAPTTRPKTQY